MEENRNVGHTLSVVMKELTAITYFLTGGMRNIAYATIARPCGDKKAITPVNNLKELTHSQVHQNVRFVYSYRHPA